MHCNFERLIRLLVIDCHFVDFKAGTLVQTMMSSEWHPFGSHPHNDVEGFYVIMRWFAKEKSWVPLFVGGGKKVSFLIPMLYTCLIIVLDESYNSVIEYARLYHLRYMS